MGVPKFFRWISERYPCLSELVKEYQIPEFDNLYLDMNGIIHTCSHPNDYDPHFRITEEKIFKDIFHYIEILFRMIQPQKLFFMAVDGVAPRAKQNQQRGRRFRSAKEAEELEKKALAQGEELPSAARFDSNCITPGTPFMVRLQAQLKFFVAYKISTDDLWQKCKIILSGHETPGEGEHKIMDYIRYMKSQPDYDSNTRHCLYGLDADLIMLGLCSHEPHFSLLREEVRFDKKSSNQRITTPEETTFFLLHLSLMREYLEHEFAEAKEDIANYNLDFKFDLECIIDDWVLMGFLVGNDFIPPLPELHINTGALPILYKTYIKVLPLLGGYINEGGTLNLPRFQIYMGELAKFDTQQFSEKFADLQYFKAKTGRRPGQIEAPGNKKKTLTAFELDDDDEDGIGFKYGALEPEKPKNPDLAQLIAATDELMLEGPSTDGDDVMVDDWSTSEESLFDAEFRQHKQDYYMNKLEYKIVNKDVLRSQAEGYVRAIQWNLNYYYNGVCSWSWFYPHHYAPYISDIHDFEDMTIEFDMGKPFLPFQQLAAVLPAASKELLPEAYQWLMVNPESPIINYYPTDFGTDLNGKRQEWEAVVLIPFIDETHLLDAMAACDDRMTSEERQRNAHGPMSVYEFTTEDQGSVEAPAYFPMIAHSHAKVTLVEREEIFVERSKLVKGLCPGTRLDVFFPGFPTLKHVPHTGKLAKGKVRVFEMPGRGENMVLTITPLPPTDLMDVATELLGQPIYVQWPHLTEALVTSVWSADQRCDLVDGQVKVTTLNLDDLSAGRASRKGIIDAYANRRGVVVGDIPILLRAQPMIGRKYTVGAQATVTLEKQWAANSSPFALQATVRDIAVNDATFVRYKTVDEVFPVGSVCFMLTPGTRYGHMGEVVDGGKAGRIKLRLTETADADLAAAKRLQQKVRTTYMQGSAAGARLGITSFLMSRVTGNLFVTLSTPPGEFSNSQHRPNIGLCLKFTKRNEEIPGYTRREPNGSGWLYSQKAVELVDAYMEAFPTLFDYLSSHTNNDDFNEEDIFPDQPGQIAAITAWIKQQPFSKVERQTCGSNCLESEVVEAIEAALDVEATSVQRTQLQVKPHLLYKPELHTGNLPPDLTATYALFDRVINVRKSFTVPLGLKGVVIGIHKQVKEEETLYDVVFDEAFPGGLSLGSSPGRSYRMPRCALINISHGKRFEEGVVASSDALNAAFASVDRSRPLPVARVFENTGINGVPRQPTRHQTQNWRLKTESTPTVAAQPSYTLLSKPRPPVAATTNPGLGAESWRVGSAPPGETDFTAMWEAMVSGGDNQKLPVVIPPVIPTAEIKPRKVAEMWDKVGPSGDRAPLQPSKKPSKAKAAQSSKPKSTGTDAGTDALKMMLGIPAPKTKPVKTKPAPAPAMTPVLVQDVFRHHAKEGASPSTRLLTAFQAQGHGIPRYTYMDCPDGSVRATVLLPNGRVYTGPPATTRQEASFSAAQLALDRLGSAPSPPRGAVVDLPPPPPHQWWQHQVPQAYQPPMFQPPPNAFHNQQPYYNEQHRSKPMGSPRGTAHPGKSGNYGPFPQPTAHFSPTKPFSPLQVAFSSPPTNLQPAFAPASPSVVVKKQQKAPTQRLIRVTGAPPAQRERSTTPTKEPESKPQASQGTKVVMGVGRGAGTPGQKKTKRIAANFKAARKSKPPPDG